jgi:hypothetical protein
VPDYTDFQQQESVILAKHRADQAESRRLARFVAIKLGDLERTDEWSIFRQHVEKLRDEALGREFDILAMMEDSVGDEHMRLRLQAKEVRGAIMAYVQILALPTTIREQVEAAAS